MPEAKGKIENQPGYFDDMVNWAVIAIVGASFIAASIGYGLGIIDLAGHGKEVFLLSFGALLRSFQSLHSTGAK